MPFHTLTDVPAHAVFGRLRASPSWRTRGGGVHAAATLGARAVAGARGHARMRKSEPVNVTKKFFFSVASVVAVVLRSLTGVQHVPSTLYPSPYTTLTLSTS